MVGLQAALYNPVHPFGVGLPGGIIPNTVQLYVALSIVIPKPELLTVAPCPNGKFVPFGPTENDTTVEISSLPVSKLSLILSMKYESSSL